MNDVEYQPLEVCTSLLSVDKKGANSIAQRINNGENFDAIIHLGFSNSREIISLERFAHNQFEMNEPDNSGRMITSGKIIEDDVLNEITKILSLKNLKQKRLKKLGKCLGENKQMLSMIIENSR